MPIARRRFAEVAHFALVEDGGDQQDGVGAVRRGFHDVRCWQW